ncbi:MAG: hypothetical protein PUB39_00155 [Eubacteriales bacterium]|nr:hypothetical protein [Eubacteriales bacterium]
MAVIFLLKKGADMSIEKKGPLGSIIVSDRVLQELVLEEIDAPRFDDMIWGSTPQGVILDKRARDEEGDEHFLQSELLEDGTCSLEFNVVTKFGVSIRNVTKDLAESVRELISDKLNLKASVIIIDIAGVRSKHVARRNTRVVYRYGAE